MHKIKPEHKIQRPNPHSNPHSTPASSTGRNDPCWCGSGKKYKKCHLVPNQNPAPSLSSNLLTPANHQIILKTPAQIANIRKSCQLVHNTLNMLENRLEAGITTNQINHWVHQYTLDHNARPAPLYYRGYPKSVCTSVNEVVCHGIPNDVPLQPGDIINVDVTSILNDYYGDSSRMFFIEPISNQARNLCETTLQCLNRAIAKVQPNAKLGDIGHAIQSHAEAQGYSVVKDFVGHGVGISFHEEPMVPHFGRPNTGMTLKAGMIFTIEPMINLGDWAVEILSDQWTAVTKDRSLSAQYEHTILVTPKGHEVLT